jgi:PIN domain nuclease of toxin-antitoxin system
MRLLIDTHALLWFCDGDATLGTTARAAMEDESNDRYVSHATAWEVAIKVSLRKLSLSVDYQWLFTTVLEANGFQMLPPSVAHYQALISLPKWHTDPFDRLLIAQAQVEGLTLISCDTHFPAYGVPLLW